jgi:tight adherence protein B
MSVLSTATGLPPRTAATMLVAACAFATVWLLSMPSPAAIRLSTLLGRTPPPMWSNWPVATATAFHRLPGHRRRETTLCRSAVIDLCDALATELTAGHPPGTALRHAAGAAPPLPLAPVLEAARTGEDVPAALTRIAAKPGCEGLRLLAGCWRIGVERGGLLTNAIEGLSEALRDEQSHREEVLLQLAGPRATARLLSALPVVGLAMATALGAHPLSFLLTTPPGAVCLILGCGLNALGLWWTSHLATAAENPR